MERVRLFFAVIVFRGLIATAAQWPTWRGPTGNGICTETGLPIHWSTNENIRWCIPLPDRGNSTPIVWDDRVFITQAISSDNRRTVICLDRRDGRQLWQNCVTSAEKESSQSQNNPQCTPSPVTDGECVIAWFGSAGLFCYDMRGRQLWQRDLGRQSHLWGYASSPILYGNLCLLNFGPGERSFLMAVNKKTGETVWRYEVPPFNAEAKWEDLEDLGGDARVGQNPEGPKVSEVDGSWATPIVVQAGGHDELVAALPLHLRGFTPRTGKLLWTCDGPNIGAYGSPFFGDGIVAFTGGGLRITSTAVRPGGRGNVTATHRVWFELQPSSKACIGTGIVYQGHIYQVTMSGFAHCLDLITGKTVWEERLSGTGVNNACWSSPVLADDRLYVAKQNADVFVLQASPRFECLATNSIGGEHMNSSLAVSQGSFFLRTDKHLWCISQRN